jgi:hypothetical protein
MFTSRMRISPQGPPLRDTQNRDEKGVPWQAHASEDLPRHAPIPPRKAENAITQRRRVPELPISSCVSPPSWIHPVLALTGTDERLLFKRPEPLAAYQWSSTYGTLIALTILRLHFQFIVAEIPEPGNRVVIQVDPGVAELIEYGAPDRFSNP